MFVVTALHTKRRPPIDMGKSSATIEKQCVERPPAVSHSHRHLRSVELSSLSSSHAPRRVSEPRMTRNEKDRDAWNRNEKGRRPPIKVPLGRPAPTRVRKFIPKPLILVERMKARQLLLESSPPVASDSRVVPESLNRSITATTAPFSTHVTPTTHRIPTCSVLLSDPHSSSVFFRKSSRNDVVSRSGCEMMPRLVRPLSVVTLADSSSSTDTFVADSPCYIKQASSKFPVLSITNVHPNVESGPGEKSVFEIGVPLLVDSMVVDSVHQTCQSTDTFEPVMTSTPLAPRQANTSHVPSPTELITSTVYPARPLEQTPEFSDSIKIVSPTSQEVYPFNAPKGAYVVKLPNSGSTASLSNKTSLASLSSTAMSYSKITESGAPLATLANPPRPALLLRRLSSRVASPSPTLVLDGVFALPRAPSSSPSSLSSSRRTLNGFPRPRKPTSRRPLSDISNALGITPPSQPLSTSLTLPSHGRSGLESPRSKLAHVLTAHVLSQTMTRTGKQTRVPPLVKGVQASNDPKTQCEIEGLRVWRAVGLGRGVGGGDVGCDSGGRGTIERISLAGIGMVAKLRQRWEAGAVEHRDA